MRRAHAPWRMGDWALAIANYSDFAWERERMFRRGAETDTRRRMCSLRLCSEFIFDETMQMVTNHRMIEALDYFVEESRDKEALGDFCRNATGAQIEQLVLLDLPRGRAVSATDVV